MQNNIIYDCRVKGSTNGGFKVIRYSPKNYEKVFENLRMFCFKAGLMCFSISGIGNGFLRIPVRTYAVILRDTDKMSAKSLIRLIDDIARYNCYIYVGIENEELVKYLRTHYSDSSRKLIV